MALRVLLADESSTIKKVVQLALQDFAVDVKAVPIGLDVLPVAKTYKPDIIFADVLITKKNGYEVCAEIKSDPETKDIPVVLMWSGFMEIDESKLQASSANDRLEKPFDAEALRNLVHKWVPRTTNNPISSYLQFPEMPDFEETPTHSLEEPGHDEMAHVHLNLNGPAANLEETQLGQISTSGFEIAELEKPLDEDSDDTWTRQDLSQFKIQIPKDITSSQFDSLEPNEIDLESSQFEEIQFGESFSSKHIASPELQDLTKSSPSISSTPKKTEPLQRSQPVIQQPSVKSFSSGDMSPEMMEKIIREEAREVIESICWKILPDIAERLVREELKKLLGEKDTSI